MQDLIDQIAAAFGVTRRELTSASQRRDIAQARQAAAWILRQQYPALSLQAIGAQLGGRDHSTIGYAIRQVEQRMACQPALAATLRACLPAAPAAEPPPPPAVPARPAPTGMRWWIAQGRSSWRVQVA